MNQIKSRRAVLVGGSTDGPNRIEPRHAVVIGASVGGLLAAQALSRHVERVTVIDRDDLPATPTARGGAAQGLHVHALMDRGARALEDLFPGITVELISHGALTGDAGLTGVYHFRPERLARTATDLSALCLSRPLLEWWIRQRLLADAGSSVKVWAGTAVVDLVIGPAHDKVVGVVVDRRDGSDPTVVDADLVVDASGRTSRTPEWLEQHGFETPPERTRPADHRYATVRMRSAPDGSTPRAVIVGPRPGVPRSGLLLAQEDGEHLLALVDNSGEPPPTRWDDVQEYARSLAVPAIADAIAPLQPVGEGATYRFVESRHRRYEQVTRFPEGLLVTADALCSFDPVYGQGMSVAAVEAQLLSQVLAAGGPDLSRRFHTAAAAALETPWAIATGTTPDEDGRLPFTARLVAAYVDRLLLAAADDPVLAEAFLRLNHLQSEVSDLLSPSIVARVLLRRRRPRSRRADVPRSPIRPARRAVHTQRSDA